MQEETWLLAPACTFFFLFLNFPSFSHLAAPVKVFAGRAQRRADSKITTDEVIKRGSWELWWSWWFCRPAEPLLPEHGDFPQTEVTLRTGYVTLRRILRARQMSSSK